MNSTTSVVQHLIVQGSRPSLSRLLVLSFLVLYLSACDSTLTLPDSASQASPPAASKLQSHTLNSSDPDIYYTARDGTVNHLDLGTGTISIIATPVSNHGAIDVDVDESGAKLYWSARNIFGSGLILRSNLDGTGVEQIGTVATGPEHIAVDPVGGKVYWRDGTAILRSNLDGTSPETILLSMDACPASLGTFQGGLTFDQVDSKIYFGWRSGLGICRADPDGSAPEIVVAAGDAPLPRGIAIDPVGRKVYYFGPRNTFGGPERIRRANLDGSSVEEIYIAPTAGSITELGSLAIDPAAGKIYWPEFTSPDHTIKRANLDGSNVEIVAVLVGSNREAVAIDLATEIVPSPPPDLTLEKSDGDVSVSPGGTIMYDLTYENIGGTDATGVILVEEVPLNTTFDEAASSPGWSCGGAPPPPTIYASTTCTFPIGVVAVGSGPASVTFAVIVSKPVPLGTTEISNTAVVEDDGTNGADPTPGNNTSTDTTPVDLSPQDRLESLDQAVTDLEGILNKGNANALHKKLAQALKKLDRGQVHVSINLLNAFINQVHDLIAAGKLSHLQGQPLIDAATMIITELE